MPSLATLLLWGPLALGAAVIPIALHFFYRSRYRVVPWAAMSFLLTSIQQTSRRLKFQEILLLAARVALLLLLALTMMRPSCSSLSSTGRGEAVDAVLVVDVSYSMGAKDGGPTRLERAKDAAHKILDSLPPSSTVQIIAGSDRATLLGPQSPSNFDQARQIIDNLEVSDLATDFLPSTREALDALKRGHAANKEVYLLSDMQKLGWQQERAALQETFSKIHQQARVVLVRCGTRKPHNATITGIQPYSQFQQTSESETRPQRSTYVVQVRNSGEEPIRDVTVTLALDIEGQKQQDRDARTLDVIKPGATREATLTAKMPVQPGMYVLSATLSSDDIAADNRFDQVINVRDKVRVLIIDGAPNEQNPSDAGAFYLQQALKSISETQNNIIQIQAVPLPAVIATHQATADLLAKADLCFLVDVPLKASANSAVPPLLQTFLKDLEMFVRNGHGLVVFAGPHVDSKTYNEILFEQYALLPLKIGKVYSVPHEHREFLDPETAAPSSYMSKFREGALKIIARVEITTALDLEPPTAEQAEKEGAAVLLRYTNGKPAVATKQHGNGEVLFITTTTSKPWSEWGKYGQGFLPFLTETLRHLLEGPMTLHNRHAGESLTWYPAVIDQSTDHQLETLSNRKVIPLGTPQTAGQRAVVSTPPIERAGVYHIMPIRLDAKAVTRPEADKKTEQVGALFAVTPDLRESADLSTFADKEIDEQLGFTAVHLTAGEELTADSVVRSSGEWWWYILLVVIGIAGFETVLAWICSRAW